MDRKLGGLIAMTCALVSASAIAEVVPGLGNETFMVYGVANETCGSYTVSRRMPGSARAYGYTQFISGYLTASGIGRKNPFPKSMDGIEGWLENYCQKNPEKDFLFALAAYTSSHSGSGAVYRCTNVNGDTVFTGEYGEGCKEIFSVK